MTPQELKKLENDLWRSADTLRANSDLKATEYSTPVLGLIFLKFADNKFRKSEPAILREYAKLKGTRREKPLSDIAVEKCGFYLPDHARYDHLLNLPEEEDIAKAIKKAMEAIEEYRAELKGTLPKDEYFRLTRTDQSIPMQLLKNFSNIRHSPKKNQGQEKGPGQRNRAQCQLSVDQPVCHLPETRRAGGAGHGQLGLGCPSFRGRYPKGPDRKKT